MAQYELNLRDYLRIFHKRRFIILSTFLVVTAVTWYYFSRQAVTYTATATLQIQEHRTVAGLLETLVYDPGGDMMASQTRVVKGFPIIKKVASRLGMINDNSPTAEINGVVSGLQGKVNTNKIEFTNMIQISVTSLVPKYSMDLANMVAEVYIEESLLEKTKQARTERNFIEEQLSRVETTLKEKENEMRVFGEAASDINVGTPLHSKLVELEFELATLKQKYTEKHPQIRQLKENIGNLQAQVKGLSAKEMRHAQILREVEVNRKLYTMLKQKLEEVRISEAQKVGDVNIIDPAVMPGPKKPPVVMGTFTGALMGLILGIGFAFIYETLDTSIGTIEDVESMVKLPVVGVIPSIEPGEKSILRRGIFGRFVKKYFQTQKSEKEENYIRLIVHNKPKSSMAEAYRNLRTNLKLTTLSIKRTLLVTSAGPREGKSTVLTNLGICLAQAGSKVLLVDTDLRRPALAKTFGVKKDPGINEVVSGAARLDEALKGVSDIMLGEMSYDDVMSTPGLENLWILPSGHIPSNPAEMLESKEMANLIEELKKRFDVVIFDTPPVLPITDASLLAPRVDGVVLCYEIGKTARDALLRAKVQLESVGAKISGIVLNHIAPQTQSATAYPYYYHYKYKSYYGQDKSEENKAEQKKEATKDEGEL